MTEEHRRIAEATRRVAHWRRWGPYLSERQWGTVREDYSPGGTAWEYFPHDHARSRAYRWGEDGLAGISDNHRRLRRRSLLRRRRRVREGRHRRDADPHRGHQPRARAGRRARAADAVVSKHVDVGGGLAAAATARDGAGRGRDRDRSRARDAR